MRRWRAILAVSALALAALPVPLAALEGPTVLIYANEGATNEGYTEFGVATGKTVDTQAVLPENLSGYDCVVLPANISFSETDLTSLDAYVNGGGRLLALGEHDGFAATITAMNGLAAALEADLSLVADGIDPWLGEGPFPTTLNIDLSPFTDGVESIQYAATSEVAVAVGPTAHSLVRTQDGGDSPGTTFIGAEQIGSGVFALSGDTNVFSDSSDSGYTLHDNDILAANICDGADFEVDLSITKTDAPPFGPDPVAVNQFVGYQIIVSNDSDTVANAVSVTDTSLGGSPASASGEGWTCDEPSDGSITCTLDSPLAANSDADDLVVLVQAPESVPEGNVISNTATVSSKGADTNTENNADTEETTVVPASEEDSVTGFVPPGGTLTTDDGETSLDNPVSAQIQVPEHGTAGIYTLGEITDSSGSSKGAVEYTGPANATEFFIVVSCDESQCPVAKKDTFILVKKLNPDGTEVVLSSCQSTIKVRGEPTIVDRDPPCVVSVERNPDGSGDLVWTVRVLGEDPIIKAR